MSLSVNGNLGNSITAFLQCNSSLKEISAYSSLKETPQQDEESSQSVGICRRRGHFFFFFGEYKKLDGKYGEDYFKLQY